MVVKPNFYAAGKLRQTIENNSPATWQNLAHCIKPTTTKGFIKIVVYTFLFFTF
jgi:hypothetical protein